ncbi:hypothetical protein [Tardiphaga sp.]|jgi:hypothetical protein|uniref:hypothetical protein n=1 Tax=Tardiphaga sp. TaxID=1926292 RepID=UPI0037DA362A
MDPLTLALLGGGSTLIGGWLNGSAQDKVNAARGEVLQAERGRQEGFDAETAAINDQSLKRFFNFGDQQDARAHQLSDYFKTPVTTPNTPYTIAALPPSTSDLTNREIAAKSDLAKMFVNNQAEKLGALRSFGDLFGGIQRGVAQDGTAIGQIGGFKKGSNAVTQLELDNANRAGNAEKMWADIATGLGKVGMTAALAGRFMPDEIINPDGSIEGALGPTSVGGKPLVGLSVDGAVGPTSTAGRPLIGLPASRFGANASPFLSYGRA